VTGAPPSQTLSCSLGDLAAGAGVFVHVTSTTDTTSCGAYPNTATANASNNAQVTANASLTVTCITPTRTAGFWQTHTNFTEWVFAHNLSGSFTVGTAAHLRTIDTNGKLLGAYYSNISYTTTGKKRTAVDHARMVLLQQLVTAKLNCAAFGCSASTQSLISSADQAYANGDKNAMGTDTTLLDNYNSGGDNAPAPAWLPNQGSATPALSQSIANLVYWDAP
jgi:hypothetical protein